MQVISLGYHKTRSPSAVRLATPRMLRRAEHAARMMENKECRENFVGGNLFENIHLDDREEDGRVVLRWFLWVGYECLRKTELTG